MAIIIKSKGLFQKAIHQSAGWSISYELDNESPAENAMKLALQLSNNSLPLTIDELRSVEPEKILTTANEIFKLGYWSVLDNHSIKRPIKEYFAEGNFHNVDLIIGSNADEELMYIDNESFKELMEEREEWGSSKHSYCRRRRCKSRSRKGGQGTRSSSSRCEC